MQIHGSKINATTGQRASLTVPAPCNRIARVVVRATQQTNGCQLPGEAAGAPAPVVAKRGTMLGLAAAAGSLMLSGR
jgi:hypothetical protein